MRFVLLTKVSAFLLAAALISAPMATAGQEGGDDMGDSKEGVAELVEEEVKQDLGVGERPKHQPKAKTGKPRMATMGVRQTWQDCVGMDAEEAVERIKTERPDLRRVVKVREGQMVTMDMRMDRVRIFCNAENVVTRPPRVG